MSLYSILGSRHSTVDTPKALCRRLDCRQSSASSQSLHINSRPPSLLHETHRKKNFPLASTIQFCQRIYNEDVTWVAFVVAIGRARAGNDSHLFRDNVIVAPLVPSSFGSIRLHKRRFDGGRRHRRRRDDFLLPPSSSFSAIFPLTLLSPLSPAWPYTQYVL